VKSRRRGRLDLATVAGLAAGLAMLGTALAMGGSLGAFVDPPAILIVLGGTFAVTMISFSLAEIGGTGAVIAQTLITARTSPRDAAILVLNLADTARQQGVLALQPLLPRLRGFGLLERGIGMAVDAIPEAEIAEAMARELGASAEQQARGGDVLRRAGEVAPAMGLIGTLVGLVQMLGALDDPSRIGPAMAVALLTTFYGAVLANMVLLPLAGKLERNAAEWRTTAQVYLLAATSIARQENPRRLEMTINAILPPASRVAHFK
jgi:chemotaxis protein MotA